jgi:hypothetical protein
MTELEPWEIEKLAGAAQMYVNAFSDDDRMTLPEAMMLTDVVDILEKLGRHQAWTGIKNGQPQL